MAKEQDIRTRAIELQQQYQSAAARVKELTSELNEARKAANKAQQKWLSVAAEMLSVSEVRVASQK